MSDLSHYRNQATEMGKKAVAAEKEKDYQEAYNQYYAASKVFMHLIKYEQNKNLVQIYKEKMGQYLDRAEYIKKQVLSTPDHQIVPQAQPPASGDAATAAKPKTKGGDDAKEEKDKLQDAISSAIVTEKPNIRWDDVAGLESAKEGLKEAVIMPVKFPQLFQGARKPWTGILLYGPPGTGKSFLAKACATECDSTFFSVSSSDLVSKWQGESERLVKNLFELARDRKPSMIFIDEVDSLCGKRTEGENESSRRIKTEFLVQMDGCGNSQEGILVMGATNTPWELDEAFRRRFEKRIYIHLPDAQARTGMFKLKVQGVPNTLTEDEFVQLGACSELYSGSDIKTVSKEALFMPIRKCQNATKFKQIQDGSEFNGFWTPCPPSDPQGQVMNMYDIPDGKLKEPAVCFDDYMQALTRIKPSVCVEDLARYEDFTAKFGQDG